jgi:AcrR family transcriptional regulator
MNEAKDLSQKISCAALELLLRQGIKKTSLEAVAYAAGVTRMTVYRYFADKQALTEAALFSIPARLEDVRGRLNQDNTLEVGEGLRQLADCFAQLPGGDLPQLLDETKRVYPELWSAFQQRRLTAIEGIFQILLARAEAQGRLRPGLNRAVLQAYFIHSVAHVLEDPALVELGLSAQEIFSSVQSIFLYGILTPAS